MTEAVLQGRPPWIQKVQTLFPHCSLIQGEVSVWRAEKEWTGNHLYSFAVILT